MIPDWIFGGLLVACLSLSIQVIINCQKIRELEDKAQ